MATEEIRKKVDARTVNTDDAQELLSTLIERHVEARRLDPATVEPLEEKAKHVNESTIGRQRTVLEAFDKWAGHPNLAEVRHREASDYMRTVLLKSDMTAKTQTWHVSALTSLSSWAILHDYYSDANPWSGLSASIRESSRGVKRDRRRPCSADELARQAGRRRAHQTSRLVLPLHRACARTKRAR
jgi:hypothetical protein